MKMLKDPPRDEVYRIKAVLYLSETLVSAGGEAAAAASNGDAPRRYILNWAFERWTFTAAGADFSASTPLSSGQATPAASGTSTPSLAQSGDEPLLRMTIVTARYESNKWRKRIESGEYIAVEGGSAEQSLSVERLS